MPRGILHYWQEHRQGGMVRQGLKFVLVGSVFATVEEFLTVLVLRGDLGAYLFTLFILFPVYLTAVWLTSALLHGPLGRWHHLGHYFLYGLIGLAIEWFAIGLTLWRDPNANPLVMLIFHLGMFSFWATIAFAPLLFVTKSELARRTRRELLRFYVPWFAITYALAFLAPHNFKFVVIIGMIVIGHLILNVFYVRYFSASLRSGEG